MTARFILSLDCEGKWGVADQLSASIHRQLSDTQLQRGYAQVVGLLDEYDVPATFAFVGLFAESEGRLKAMLPELRAIAQDADYLAAALGDLESGSREGWHGDWAIDQLQASRTRHELALHGITHVPWDMMNRDQARRELALMGQMESPLRRAETFVYPRNRVAHTDLLPEFGILGFRQSPPAKSRLASLLAEFDIFTRPDSDPPLHRPQPIPAGHFVNWQSSMRRAVPIALSVARATRMLAEAATSGGIVHFWLHPENVVTAPRTLVLLRAIIELAARERDAGRCDIITQIDYCRSLAGLARAAE